MEIIGARPPSVEFLKAKGLPAFVTAAAICPACWSPDGLQIVVVDPPTVGSDSVPGHLSAAVARSLRQAEDNFRREDSEEASATMYRRAIDLAIKEIAPDLKGDLMPRILALVEDGRLPAAMGDWAHQVRIVGNDGAHDIEGVNRTDLEAARGFTDAFLRYLITLPKDVEERRRATEPPKVPD
jgi:hypothetical protein